MQDSPRSLTLIMSIGGIILLFILGAILAVSITEAMVTSVDREVSPAPVVAAEATGDGHGEEAASEEAATEDSEADAEPAAEAEAEAPAEADAEAPAEEAAAEEAPAEAAAPVAVEPVPVTDELVSAFTKGTCIACHVIPGIQGAVGMVGPDMTHIGTDAATRVPGQSAVDYIHESIVDPMAFTAPECPFGPCVTGAMPPGLDQLVSEDELNLMVNYLAGLE